MQKITPFLWFDGQAEEAAKFYVSIFKNSKIIGTMPGPGEAVAGVTFELDGQIFMSINGGPHFKFTEAISLYIDCKDQKEVDYYWEKLSEGGEESQCGWLKDKFGLSWQVIPKALTDGFQDKDPQTVNRVMQAMLKMKKINVAEIEKARRG